ncbi:MAG: hypothetical protein A2Y38_17055 [Spirochaetes bacterium GWB1_59_5]|nr:MAG: hypothetical protein A2Y38_17055 [Spirochaetes bacterium GWB1_59_5]
MRCIVVCREDRKPDGTKGDYTLATRTVFENAVAAQRYAGGISDSRDPIVVPGDFEGLLFNTERGTQTYWEQTSYAADSNQRMLMAKHRRAPVGVPDEDGALGDVDGDDA